MSGSRPRGGASSAPAPLLLRARHSVRSPSGHCYEAAGCRSAAPACGLTPGLALWASPSENPAGASPQASGSERVWGGEERAELRTPSDSARASRSPCKHRSGWGPLRMRMEGRARSARRPAARGRGGAHHLSEADHLSFLVGSTPSRVDLRRSRPLAAVLCLTALGIRVLPELGRAACFGVKTPRGAGNHQDAGHTFTRAQPGLDGQCEPEKLG
ncbi:hypothetical protein J1605_002920 [Eschrichtius robustus]|uniref:Uncharacterized protein n=1 Tax=Eschrichtius robustus TaxID=9764 RepID=A0AB34HT95_ESCRO|nr:hypothetical protein J1605_002920 [Eschrichtius robustus]